MDEIIKEVYDVMITTCNKEARPADLIKIGVDILHKRDISNVEKKAILRQILTKIALGEDGVVSYDDRLSPQTLEVLFVIVDSGLIDVVIDGIVLGTKKITSKCWGRFLSF